MGNFSAGEPVKSDNIGHCHVLKFSLALTGKDDIVLVGCICVDMYSFTWQPH